MKFISAVFGTILAFIILILTQNILYKFTGRYYSTEHASGTFSYVYFAILAFTPFLGGIIGWQYWATKLKSLLWFFPIYFVVIYLFHWYSAVYAGYPLFN